MGIAHLSVELRLWHKGCYGVHHQHIDGVRPDQRFDDLQCLLTIVRLADQQIVDVYSELASVGRIERMLRIHKRRQTTSLLRLCNNLQRNRCLTRGFRAKDLNNASSWNSTHTQCCVERDGTRRNDRNRHDILRAEPHDGTLAKLLLQPGKSQFYCFATVICHVVSLLCG